MVQSVDNVALLPAYLAAGTVLLVLLTDLFIRRAVLAVAALGAAATAVGAALVGRGGDRATFCVSGTRDCSYIADNIGALIAVLFALLTLGVLVLSAPLLRSGTVPVGEYCFLGVNATLRDGLTVAPECVIGAGATLLHDTEKGEVYPGQGAEAIPKKSWELRGL